ncbi:ABC transporter, substrate-binding protein (cluster 5, nickel/peptides/opines), partial [hydrothermal vent metagenome]
MIKRGTLAVFTLLLLLSACHKAKETPPNTFVIGVETGPAMLDPRLATDSASSKAFDLLFNGLVKREDDFSIVPDLAETWEVKDRLKYVFHLRKNVQFHNGVILTSADVKAVYDFVLDPANKSPHRGTFKVIDSIETPDDQTVIFNLKEKNAPFLGSLTFAIVQKGTKAATEHPIGTGPFKLVEYKRDEQLTFVKHENYFEGAPNLDGVIFKIVPDETVRTLELERGAVHMIMNPITPDLLPRFRKNESLKVITQLGTNYSYLGFNMEDKLAGDKNVREAIALAIDRKSIIEHILKGLAQPATGPISPASRFYEGDVKTYKRDIEKAKQILDDAGHKDPDGDGPQKRFTLRYSTSQNELRKRIAEVFQWQLSEAGIGIDIRSYEWGT